MFGYSLTIEEVNSIERFDGDDPFFTYTYKAIVRDRTGYVLAESVGKANSKEKKHRYRWISEKYATAEQKKTAVGRKKNEKGYWIISIPNPDIYDLPNTLCKVAQKRAYVGATLLASNCSAFFVSAESAQTVSTHDNAVPDNRTQWDTVDAEVVEETYASQPQQRRLWAIATKAGHNEPSIRALLETFGIDSFKNIPVAQYDTVCTQAGNETLAQFFLAQTEEPTPVLD